MPTDRSLITVSDLVRRAAAIVDPGGDDGAVAELATRFEDDDDDGTELLRLAARAEFDGDPARPGGAWLEEHDAAL